MTKDKQIIEKLKELIKLWQFQSDNKFYTDILSFEDLIKLKRLESELAALESQEHTSQELTDDLKQYITNLLYDALEQGFKLRHYANIGGDSIRNADTNDFDKWVIEQWDLIDEYLSSK